MRARQLSRKSGPGQKTEYEVELPTRSVRAIGHPSSSCARSRRRRGARRSFTGHASEVHLTGQWNGCEPRTDRIPPSPPHFARLRRASSGPGLRPGPVPRVSNTGEVVDFERGRVTPREVFDLSVLQRAVRTVRVDLDVAGRRIESWASDRHTTSGIRSAARISGPSGRSESGSAPDFASTPVAGWDSVARNRS
jgi:hypothetical protein